MWSPAWHSIEHRKHCHENSPVKSLQCISYRREDTLRPFSRPISQVPPFGPPAILCFCKMRERRKVMWPKSEPKSAALSQDVLIDRRGCAVFQNTIPAKGWRLRRCRWVLRLRVFNGWKLLNLSPVLNTQYHVLVALDWASAWRWWEGIASSSTHCSMSALIWRFGLYIEKKRTFKNIRFYYLLCFQICFI